MTLLLTAIALVAFASNSILSRLALAPREIDAASFTSIRLVSGALTLVVLYRVRTWKTPKTVQYASWISAALLFLYAAPFSFAYIALGAGTGALILFTCVQATMLLAGIRSGERLRGIEGIGLVIALVGLATLLWPRLAAPSPFGSALMAVAGVSWGIYSLRGRDSRDPLRDTVNNFVWATPLALFLSFVGSPSMHASPRAVVLAAASGALASGLGYTLWFAALRGLSAIHAATVQLTVPVLVAGSGALFLGETVTFRLVLSAMLILGGVGLALASRFRK